MALKWLENFFFKKEVIYRYVEVDDIPANLIEEKVYVVGEKGFKWVAILLCPCGCGEVIMLNLLKGASPCWKIKMRKKRKITIRPSVWRTLGCRSHFNLINGRIYWH